jgi:hypothetical protein
VDIVWFMALFVFLAKKAVFQSLDGPHGMLPSLTLGKHVIYYLSCSDKVLSSRIQWFDCNCEKTSILAYFVKMAVFHCL